MKVLVTNHRCVKKLGILAKKLLTEHYGASNTVLVETKNQLDHMNVMTVMNGTLLHSPMGAIKQVKILNKEIQIILLYSISRDGKHFLKHTKQTM